MKYQIAYSPLASLQPIETYQMPADEAQTLYPSLRGQCHNRQTCRFTMSDVRQGYNSESMVERS